LAGEPVLIQGGMGVGISNWELARAVAMAGERLEQPVLGVISGTGLAITTAVRLRKGDPNTRRAVEAFIVPEIAESILDKYWLSKARSTKATLPPKPEVLVNGAPQRQRELINLLVVANFAEVWLAKEGHDGPIGVNYLEKIQLPRLPEIFGAMLAGVDYVLMGAGIPNLVPGVLDALAGWNEATYRLDVTGGGDRHVLTFDPKEAIPAAFREPLKRPKFLAIVSHHALAQALALKANGEVDGFVVEGPMAGGHNAPARGKEINDRGEPVYGERDRPDLEKIKGLGKPFWLAGGYSTPERLADARETGAAGVQVGSAFALCDESGLRDDIKRKLRERSFTRELLVLADPVASPSGFPFQVVDLEGTLSDQTVYEGRKRDCSLGYLVEAYRTKRGGLGFRCPAEPVNAYVKKGGSEASTEGRLCLCNGLAATAKDGQPLEGSPEPPVVTLGQDLGFVRSLLPGPDGAYTAGDVISAIMARRSASTRSLLGGQAARTESAALL
jgi:NAD(P)H-dependent flavin oxidoreductase YrpB (nitropropane dioxygenase family)